MWKLYPPGKAPRKMGTENKHKYLVLRESCRGNELEWYFVKERIIAENLHAMLNRHEQEIKTLFSN